MLKKLLHPSSIAIIGASHHPDKLGYVVVKNLKQHNYRGRIYPVNPKGGTVLGYRVYPSVRAIRRRVDLAVIVVPADYVSSVLAECGQAGIRAVVIITAGFGESGTAGQQRELAIHAIARKYHIRVIGPNCLGIIVPSLKLNASFAAGMPAVGRVAVISQSGAMAVAITDLAISSRLGFSALVSMGNKMDVSEEELIEYYGRDPHTNVITMYLENLHSGRQLLTIIHRVSRKKPIVILLAGRSDAGKHAIVSHTGALAGAHDVHIAALRDAGAIIAYSLEDLFGLSRLFDRKYSMSGSGVGIITNAGGPGILATDAVSAYHALSLAQLSSATVDHLRQVLPSTAAVSNPIDVVGDAPVSRYRHALQILVTDPHVAGVVALLTHQYVTDTIGIARTIIAVQRQHPRVPIIGVFIGGQGVRAGRDLLTRAGIIHFEYPEQAVWALAALRQYATTRLRYRAFPDSKQLRGKSTSIVLGRAAESKIRAYVPGVIRSELAADLVQAKRLAKKIGYPIVAKVVSNRFVHKTDHNLVAVNIINQKQLITQLNHWQKQHTLYFMKDEGFLLQPYISGALETIVGAKRDPVIGPYLIVGVGGIFVEALQQTEIIPLPINRQQARDALRSGVLGAIFNSSRGKKLNQSALGDVLVGMSNMMRAIPAIEECDLNPIMVTAVGATTVDVRIVINR